jgi:hypothetical protein
MYSVHQTSFFEKKATNVILWIAETLSEHSIDLAVAKIEQFEAELDKLEIEIMTHPFIGLENETDKSRSFPIYEGRYRIVWIVQGKQVFIIDLWDQKYPTQSKTTIQLDE